MEIPVRAKPTNTISWEQRLLCPFWNQVLTQGTQAIVFKTDVVLGKRVGLEKLKYHNALLPCFSGLMSWLTVHLVTRNLRQALRVLIRLILIIFVNFFLFLWDLGIPTPPFFAPVIPFKLLILLQALFLLIWSFKHFHYFYSLI